MREWAEILLLAGGTFFCLTGGVGLLRFPDFYTRLSATSKASTLGAGLLVVAAAVHFGDASVIGIALATLGFLVLTMPVAAHMIARAAYFEEVPLWEETTRDERREYREKVSRGGLAGDSSSEEDRTVGNDP